MDDFTKLALMAKQSELKMIISPEEVIIFLLTTKVFDSYVNGYERQFLFELPLSLLCTLGKIWYKRSYAGFAFVKESKSEFNFTTKFFTTHEDAVEHFIDAIIEQYG